MNAAPGVVGLASNPSATPPPPTTTAFEVYVSKDTFKFNAAHFVAFAGFRERLHGHNYKVGVRLLGQRKIGVDGYLIDFGIVKDVCKKACKALNERFLCPVHSDVLDIAIGDESVEIYCPFDGAKFVIPRGDCALLPIVHATTEELGIYLYSVLLRGLDADYLQKRGIHTMEISVAEAIGQEATFRFAVPDPVGPNFELDVRKFITEGAVVPMPCLPDEKKQSAECCEKCTNNQAKLSEQLSALATAINSAAIKGPVTESDLENLLNPQSS